MEGGSSIYKYLSWSSKLSGEQHLTDQQLLTAHAPWAPGHTPRRHMPQRTRGQSRAVAVGLHVSARALLPLSGTMDG